MDVSRTDTSFSPTRTELVKLVKMKDDIDRILGVLVSSKNCLSGTDRHKIISVLWIYGKYTDKNVIKDIDILLEKPCVPLSIEIRSQIREKILHLFQICPEYVPQNDDERFDRMIYERSLLPPYVNLLFEKINIVYEKIQVNDRKITWLGDKPNECFENVVSKWGFENPYKYFHYTGGFEIPQNIE